MAVVVGSDQVWRAKYGNLSSYLLDFIPTATAVKRIAYAASFGVSRAELPIQKFAPLARQFDALSVREMSGIEICRHEWGVQAEQMPDPTLLLTDRDYRKWIGEASEGRGGAVFYVLDASAAVSAALQGFGRSDQMRPDYSLMDNDLSSRTSKARVGVESWLSSLAGASSVVTDSFHGTVFSIIFNRPFVAIANAERGIARFETLLSAVGLADRLIQTAGLSSPEIEEMLRKLVKKNIDWSKVNAAIEAERARGRDFLRASLNEPN